MRRLIAVLLAVTLLFTVLSFGAVVSANTLSAENNRFLEEDFDDGEYDAKLITGVMGLSKISVEDGALKVNHTGGDNVRYRIEAKKAFPDAPAGKAGKLTYEFDVKVINHTGDANRSVVARDVSTNWNTATSFLTMKPELAYSATTNTIKTGDSTTDGDWYQVKLVFDYTGGGSPTYSAYVNGKSAKTGGTINNNYDPYDSGVGFATYASVSGLTYYIDNLRISYVEVEPELISGISVAGQEVEGFVSSKSDYEMIIPESRYDALAETDVLVSFADGFSEENSTVTKEVSETGSEKSVSVTIESGGYSASYTVVCSPKPEPNIAYNGMLFEDFDSLNQLTGHPFISSEGGITEIVEEDGRGKVLKRTYPASGNHNVRTYFKASGLAGAARKIGTLTYEFDMKVTDDSDGTNGVSKGAYGVGYGFHVISGNTVAERMAVRYNNVLVSGQSGTIRTEEDDWNKLKVVYNYTGSTLSYSVYVNNTLFKENLTENTYDAFDEAAFHYFGAANGRKISYYLDNVKIRYIEAQPEIVTALSLGGAEITDFDPNTYEYTLDVYEEEYDELSENDIEVTVDPAFSDITSITKSVTETVEGKTVTVVAESGDYLCNYKIDCKRKLRPATINIGQCTVDKEKRVHFQGTLESNIGTPLSRPMIAIVRTKDNTDILQSGGIDVFSSDSGGNFEDEIMLFDDEETPKLYTMEVLFDVFGAEEPLIEEITYINEKQLKASVEYLKSSGSAVFEYMISADDRYSIRAEENREIFKRLGVWIDKYEAEAQDRAQMNTAISSYRDSLTVDNIAKIANGSLVAVIMSDREVSTENAVALTEQFSTEIASLAVSDNKFEDLSTAAKKWVVENARTNKRTKGFDTWETFSTEIRKSMLLYSINNTPYTKMADLILANTELLDDPMTALKNQKNKSLADEAMRSVELAANQTDFTTVEDLVSAVKKALTDQGQTGGGSTGSGTNKPTPASIGGGSSGGGGSQSGGKEEDETFTDLAGYEWAKDAIQTLNRKGIVSGVGNGKFEPGRNVTREEFVKLLCESVGIEKISDEIRFDDVKENDWFKDYVSAAVQKGIVKGVSETEFGTGRSITREDMAVMLYRALLTMEIDLSAGTPAFEDADEIADYAQEAVSALANEGIVSGVGNGMFAPKATATRAEAAVIIMRSMERFSLNR